VGALAAMDEMPKCQCFAENGFVVVTNVVDGDQCDVVANHVQALENDGAGSRALLDQAWCAEMANQLRRHSELCALLPADTVAVQCTLFDKSHEKNWLVSLHQDLSIPVRRRVTSPECSGWSEKEGQVYVQPPVGVLEQLFAVRVHIDDCPAESGALRVVAKSHVEGRLSRARAEELRRLNGETMVPVGRGGALVMRPLILHASSKATELRQRRVLHFVFGPPTLPSGLEWRWGV
jgi:ectoine hydroxylase-related dioxygenase (phytanoyl-CoA dioxygenase family)